MNEWANQKQIEKQAIKLAQGFQRCAEHIKDNDMIILCGHHPDGQPINMPFPSPEAWPMVLVEYPEISKEEGAPCLEVVEARDCSQGDYSENQSLIGPYPLINSLDKWCLGKMIARFPEALEWGLLVKLHLNTSGPVDLQYGDAIFQTLKAALALDEYADWTEEQRKPYAKAWIKSQEVDQ